MRRNKKLFLVGLLLFAGALIPVVTTLEGAGAFRAIDEHGPEVAQTVSGFGGGTEDVVFRGRTAELFVSSANFQDPSQPGAIYQLDLTALGAAPVDVTPQLDFPFQPHGIDLWRGPEGQERLFVVNHRNGSGFTTVADVGQVRHTVEIFDVAPSGALRHVRSVESSAITSPNDVAAVGAEQFYVTNDHGAPPGIRRSIEDWLRLPLGSVAYFDGETSREVFGGLRYPNGVATSSDGTEVYVAETTGNHLRALRRDAASGALTETWKSEPYTGLDNIDVAPDGSLWIGAHPKLLDFLGHAKDLSLKSPSQVLHATRQGDGWAIEEFWLDAGDQISGSSVAASNGEVVVVGAVFQPRLLVIPVK